MPEILFADYEKLIKKRAWIWLRRINNNSTYIDIEDLIQEGNLVYCKSLRKFDINKSKFSTFLYNSLELRFTNIQNERRTKKRSIIMTDSIELDFLSYEDHENNVIFFRDIVDDIPSDCIEIIKAVFDTPTEIIDVLGYKQINLFSILKYFYLFKKWDKKRLLCVVEEIRSKLNINKPNYQFYTKQHNRKEKK